MEPISARLGWDSNGLTSYSIPNSPLIWSGNHFAVSGRIDTTTNADGVVSGGTVSISGTVNGDGTISLSGNSSFFMKETVTPPSGPYTGVTAGTASIALEGGPKMGESYWSATSANKACLKAEASAVGQTNYFSGGIIEGTPPCKMVDVDWGQAYDHGYIEVRGQ